VLLACASACVWLTVPATALAASGTWREGTSASSPFSLAPGSNVLQISGASLDPALTLPYEAKTLFADPTIEFRSLSLCANGDFLVSGGQGLSIKRVSSGGVALRTYSDLHDLTNPTPWKRIAGLVNPFDAVELPGGGMLIVDRDQQKTGQGRVVRLDSSMNVVASVSATPSMVPGAEGLLYDPFAAVPLSNGNTLIADAIGCQVVETNLAGSFARFYGLFWKPGSTGGLIDRPHSAQRLDNGNTLICDSANNRIIEVTPAKSIVWQYDTAAKTSGGPNFAHRLPGINANTLICDTESNHVIEVDYSTEATVQAFGADGRTPAGGALKEPRAAVRATDGRTVIADNGNKRLVSYGYPTRREYTATSAPIDPKIGSTKWFTKITVAASIPAGSLLASEYSTDGLHWFAIPSGGKLPTSANGSAIRYRLHLTAGRADAAPIIRDVSIDWTTTAPSTGSAKSSNSGTKKKSSKSTSSSTTGSSSSGSNSSSSGSSSHAGGSAVTSGGSGSADTTTVAPGGGSNIGGGTTGGAGGAGGDAVQQSTTMSGWVMSEVQDNVGGTTGSSGTGGFGSASSMKGAGGTSGVLLVTAYVCGLGWVPGTRLAARLVAVVMPH
jgi:hypothetical protein